MGLKKSTEARQGWTHKKTTLLQKNCGKKDQKRRLLYTCKVVFYLSLPWFFCTSVVFLVFSSLPCFCTFFRPIPTHVLVLNFYRKILTPSFFAAGQENSCSVPVPVYSLSLPRSTVVLLINFNICIHVHCIHRVHCNWKDTTMCW